MKRAIAAGWIKGLTGSLILLGLLSSGDAQASSPMPCNATLSSAPLNTQLELDRLLQQRLDHPEQAEAIDAEIQCTFSETHAVLISDMSGFSRLTATQGIFATLATIYQMRRIAVPIVEAHHGQMMKLEADNLYAVFPTVADAIAAATDLIQTLAPLDIHLSIGIGYGDLLTIRAGDRIRDTYGDQMNQASRLGEDIAEADDVLLTEAAYAAIAHQLDPDSVTDVPTPFPIRALRLNWAAPRNDDPPPPPEKRCDRP